MCDTEIKLTRELKIRLLAAIKEGVFRPGDFPELAEFLPYKIMLVKEDGSTIEMNDDTIFRNRQ